MATSYNSISRNRRWWGRRGSLRDRARREGRKRRRRASARLGSPSASAGHQLAIRALIAFECNVAENFI